VRQKEGAIIWHTQGSGKSIVMVLLARWILETNPNARVAIITDRDELDKQIKRVFEESGEKIEQSTSGLDLIRQLGQATPRLLCSLVHKFGRKDVDDFEAFIKDLEAKPSQTVGEVFVFVDECHRTQSGKLHRVMKADDAQRRVHWFYWHAATEEGQGNKRGSLRWMYSHVQIQRGSCRRRSIASSVLPSANRSGPLSWPQNQASIFASQPSR